MDKKLDFKVSSGLTLNLKNLWASVSIRTGGVNQATVSLSGDEKLLKDIQVTQPSSDSLSIEGQGGADGITVIQSGRRSSISIGNVRGGNLVITNGVVIRNGQVVTGGTSQLEDTEMPTITITVPEGTELDAESVEELKSQGLNGKLYLSVDGQGKANVQGVNGGKVDCSGQTRAEISNAQGDLKISCSGQSRITAKGNFGDIDADSSGQSQVTIVGNCQDCNADASGMSTVSLIGHASGKVRKHESGMSTVSIG